MNMNKVLRIAAIACIALFLIIIILITRAASEQSGTNSNKVSSTIVNYAMESLIDNDIPVNRDDVFWRLTANVMIRNAAHFIEYMFIGLFLSVLFNFFTRKMWITVPGAAIVCFALACFDEYRQQFVEGRESTWFDVKIDTFGSLTGIFIVMIFFIFYNRIRQLKAEVRKLEEELENNKYVTRENI